MEAIIYIFFHWSHILARILIPDPKNEDNFDLWTRQMFFIPRDVLSPHNFASISWISEFKHGVYGRRQTAKMTSEFVFFSSNR